MPRPSGQISHACGARQARTPRVGRGFTLIELLVVIAIVAVVLAILVPTLASAREAGRAAVCLVNQRQIAMIQTLYAQDHRGEGPALTDRTMPRKDRTLDWAYLRPG